MERILILPAPWGISGTIANMIADLAAHEDEHTRSILNWIHAR